MFESSQQQTEDKILLLYVLEVIEIPITDLQFNNIMLGSGLINYFTLQMCLADLIEKKCVERRLDDGGVPMYVICDKGKQMLATLQEIISPVMRRRVNDVIKGSFDAIKRETEVNALVFRDDEDNAYVRCYMREGTKYIVDIKAQVGSVKDATNIAEAWKANTSVIFTQLMKLLYDQS